MTNECQSVPSLLCQAYVRLAIYDENRSLGNVCICSILSESLVPQNGTVFIGIWQGWGQYLTCPPQVFQFPLYFN